MADSELTILVVDDSDINLKLTVTMLKNLKYKVISTLTPETVEDIVERKRPDLILMDYLMPGMNGTDIAKNLRARSVNQRDYYSAVPIVLLTAEDQNEDTGLLLKSGINDILFKPLTLDSLNRVLGKYFSDASVIPGIDADAAAALISSDESAELFALFIEDTSGKVKRISEAEKSGDYESFTVDVHRLKSEAKMLGATALSELARELELVGKALTGVIDNGTTSRQNKRTLSEKTPVMLHELIEISARIKQYLASKEVAAAADEIPVVNAASEKVPAADDVQNTEASLSEVSGSVSEQEPDSTPSDAEDALKASKERARARALAAQAQREAEAELKAAAAQEKPKNPKEDKIVRYVGYAKDALAKGDTALVKNWLDEILEVIDDA